jgi:peptide methionine sulfoxide reductase MsrA
MHTQVGNDRGTQYRHGVYYHSEEQKKAAEQVFSEIKTQVCMYVCTYVCIYVCEEKKKAAKQVLSEIKARVYECMYPCM